MKVIEVRDGFIKFETEENICLSSFIKVSDIENEYIAQINQIRTIGNIKLASAKILFVLKDNELHNYDNSLPSKDSEICSFTFDILTNSIKTEIPIIIGKTLDNLCNITIDASAFNKKMLISVDDKNIHNVLIKNLEKQFEHINKKFIVIDTLGVLNGKKAYAGVDFKLPLDSSNLEFMYESCLDDATAESKNTIIDIFKDLSEYSQTIPFVPFGVLRTIVDDMVDKQHIFKLFVLKNKLAKFAKFGYFATQESEVTALDNILESNSVIIDLSKIDSIFQNRFLEYIYEKIGCNESVQVIVELSNTISKKNLKKIIEESSIPSTIITHSNFKYLKDIQSFFDNFIIEPSSVNNSIFNVYSSFLSSMEKNMYLITGEAINYIPMVSYAQKIDNIAECTINQTPKSLATQGEETDSELDGRNEDFDCEEQNSDEKNNISEEDLEESDIIDALNTQEQIINAINVKSKQAIKDISKNLDLSESPNIFEEDEINEDEAEENLHNESDSIIEDNFIQSSDSEGSFEEEDIETLSFSDESTEEETAVKEADSTTEDEGNLVIDEYDSGVLNLDEDTQSNVILDENTISEEEDDDNNFHEINNESEDDIAILDNSETQNDDESLIIQEGAENENNMLLSGTEDEDSAENLITDDSKTEIIDIQEEESIELNQEDELLLNSANEVEAETEKLPDSNLDVHLDTGLSDTNILDVNEDSLTDDFDEILELDSEEASENDIVVDLSENESNEVDEDIEQEIIDDVDKVYTTRKENEELESISDSDLDFIDELNSDEELEEYQEEELEEIPDSNLDENISEDIIPENIGEYNDSSAEILEKRDSSTPIVPVYDADIPQEDIVVSDPIEQGDAVVHAKYGNGVVEKMIKYGSKTLFAINFENVGRRLLDPTLTEIKRV